MNDQKRTAPVRAVLVSEIQRHRTGASVFKVIVNVEGETVTTPRGRTVQRRTVFMHGAN